MNHENIFHPYEVVSQSQNSLELRMGNKSRKMTDWALRLPPLVVLSIGVILYLIEKDPVFIFIFGGVAVLEAIVFLFIKIPTAVKMDSMGFTVTSVSLRGEKEAFYLWNDVDYIRYRTVRTKNTTLLNYHAVLKTNKKVRFLGFSNYQQKKEAVPGMNEAIRQVSNKEVKQK